MKPKIALLGAAHGHMYSYAAALRRLGADITGVADESEPRGREAAARLGTSWARDAQTLLASDADAVVICAENSGHAALAEEAAQAGKHMLCEKPLADSAEGAARIVSAAREAGVKLMTAFPCRFHPAAAAMKRDAEAGVWGELLAIQGANRGTMPGGWFVDRALSGGGAIIDHTVHVVDLMRWIMPGAEVKEVYAEKGTRMHDLAVEDCGLLVFSFDNGVIASLDPSWSRTASYPTWGDVKLELVGTAGVGRVDLFRQNLVLHEDRTMRTAWTNWGSDMDLGLVAEFIGCIREDRPPAVTGEDGQRALLVALAAYESASSGQPARVATP